MKKLLLLPLFAIIVSCATAPKNMISDSKTKGMTKIEYSVKVKAPKEIVWNMLEDFDNLSWSKTVNSAHYLNKKRSEVGMSRHCNLADGGYIVETISKWDQGNGFTYTLDDSSDPIDPKSYAIWKVKKDGKNSIVSFTVHYDLKYGILGDMMNSLFAKDKFAISIKGFMNELKDRVELKRVSSMKM